jgi:hypothetical protein
MSTVVDVYNVDAKDAMNLNLRVPNAQDNNAYHGAFHAFLTLRQQRLDLDIRINSMVDSATALLAGAAKLKQEADDLDALLIHQVGMTTNAAQASEQESSFYAGIVRMAMEPDTVGESKSKTFASSTSAASATDVKSSYANVAAGLVGATTGSTMMKKSIAPYNGFPPRHSKTSAFTQRTENGNAIFALGAATAVAAPDWTMLMPSL